MTDLRTLLLLLLQLTTISAYCQQATPQTGTFTLVVVGQNNSVADGATVKMLRGSQTLQTTVTNATGNAVFNNFAAGTYTFAVTYTGYKPFTSKPYQLPGTTGDTIRLQTASTTLNEVAVTARKPMIQHEKGKTIVNVDASPTNTGTSVLEVLEKSPGVLVDRNGGISMQGKSGVLVMIDDKPTYLSGADLNNLLSGMSSSQVASIELITNPSARYDAANNAGIINIKTKKNNQTGFNGTATTAYGQGRYPKVNNSLILNFRTGKVNTFFNYGSNYGKYLTDLYALRKYYDANNTVTQMLEQPAYFTGDFFHNNIKTGLDYYAGDKTTLGLSVSGTTVPRDGNNNSTATWQTPAGAVDSVITTANRNSSLFKSGTINVNIRHKITERQDISADVDYLHYDINSDQDFTNSLQAPGGYTDLSRGNISTGIKILTGKADYTLKDKKEGQLQLGWKSSLNQTDNMAAYEDQVNGQWTIDYTKTNHFIYKENIHAAYATYEKKLGKLSTQAGLRYEYTGYEADQRGNAQQADTAFSRNYGQLFPSGYVSYQVDSTNSFTLTAGRRIDRPVFQNLNPFYFIINKYTYQTGNPYILPQLSWNFELSHQYKELLTTTLSYANISNYFSQLFLKDDNKGILLYTQGNVGHTYIVGLAEAVSAQPAKWWSLTGQVLYNYKKLSGFNGNNYTTDVHQVNFNLNNQFTIGKYTAEISGFYTTRARNDVQERLYPTGQLSAGISRPVLNKKGTIKFSARDIFYTNAMEGLTQFPNATEYFKLMRDSRVFNLSFTYRFGKQYKAAKRSQGGASDEADRVGSGG